TPDAVFLDAAEKLLETKHFGVGLRAGDGARRHEPAEATDDGPAEDAGDDPGQAGHAGLRSPPVAAENNEEPDEQSAADVALANGVGPVQIVAVHYERVEHAIANRWELVIER